MSVSPTLAAEEAGGGAPHLNFHTIFMPSYYSPSPPTGSVSTPDQYNIPASVVNQADEKSSKGGRRGHKKSRGACFTCRRQKIKCKENRPSCDYCAHRGIKCEWPTLISKPSKKRPRPEDKTIVKSQEYPKPLEPTLSLLPKSIQSHDVPRVFTMEDMRLFNHFVQRAYPRYPSGNDSIWTREIPSLASNYDYLIHSMLALSASELSLTDGDQKSCPQTLRNSSLYHRSKSITALNSAIQRGVNSYEEGNAMLATIFSLLFQSTFVDDGLVEYMTFIRGGIVVGGQMVKQHFNIVFRNMNVARPPSEKGLAKDEDGLINDAPILQEEVVLGAVKSLELCEGLCRTKLEKRVHRTLMDIATSLVISSTHAYVKLREMYALFALQMTPTEFRIFTSTTSPSAQTFKILQAHFVALQLIMNPVAAKEAAPRAVCPVKDVARAATAGWLVSLHRDVDNILLTRYCSWTRWVELEILGGRLLDGSKSRSVCVFHSLENAPGDTLK